MTFFHFINCCALAFAPFFIVYKYSGLSEYSSVWRCVQAALAYLLTQLVKLLTIATFLPTSELEGQQYDVVNEALKSCVDVLDLIGIYLVMQYALVGKGEIRFVTAGLGWASADAAATRLVPFWVGARGIGFDWRYTLMALESSINLVHWVAAAAIVWVFVRYELPPAMRHISTALLATQAARTFVYAYVRHARCAYRARLFSALTHSISGALMQLLMKLLFTVTEASIALVVYCTVTRPTH